MPLFLHAGKCVENSIMLIALICVFSSVKYDIKKVVIRVLWSFCGKALIPNVKTKEFAENFYTLTVYIRKLGVMLALFIDAYGC